MNTWIKENSMFIFLQLMGVPFDVIFTVWYLPILSLMPKLFVLEYAPLVTLLMFSFIYIGMIGMIHILFFCITPDRW